MASPSKSLRFLMLLLLLSALLPGVTAAAGQSVIVADYTVVPSVVMPGEEAIVHVTIQNAASISHRTDSVYLTEIFPVSTSESQDVYLVIGSVFLDGRGDIRVLEGNSAFTGVLGPGQSMDLAFLIRAPEKSGIYFPQLRIRVRGGESVIYPFPVNVNTPIYSLKVPIIRVSQDELPFVAPGETFETGISVANIGQSAAQEISVSVIPEDMMIAPIGSASSSRPLLAPGEAITIPLAFRISKAIDPGLYELPVIIQYRQADGSVLEEIARCAVDVRGASSLAVSAVRTDPVTVHSGQPFDLIVRLENTGTGRANSVVAYIDAPISGSREAFVGSIRSGNDAPAVFRLAAGEGGEIPSTLTVRYSDDYGDHRIDQPITLVVQQQGMEGAAIALVIIVVLAGAGYYLYRQRKQG